MCSFLFSKIFPPSQGTERQDSQSLLLLVNSFFFRPPVGNPFTYERYSSGLSRCFPAESSGLEGWLIFEPLSYAGPSSFPFSALEMVDNPSFILEAGVVHLAAELSRQ